MMSGRGKIFPFREAEFAAIEVENSFHYGYAY
jgi:hypothetical protein